MGHGARLEDRDLGWKAFFERVKIKDARVKVGVLASGKGGEREVGPDGTPGDLTVAEIAAIHEFGTQDRSVPERSFLRSTFDEKREELAKMGKALLLRVLDGKLTVRQALEAMGMKLAAETKKKITAGAGIPPPLRPSTVAAKGSDRPLVDTGRLLNAITWAVENSGDKEE